MNSILNALAEEPALRAAVNLALGALAASTFGLLLAMFARRNAALKQSLLASALIAMAVLPALLVVNGGGGLLRIGVELPIEQKQMASGQGGAAQRSALPASPSTQTFAPPPMEPVAQEERTAMIVPERNFPVKPLLWGALWVWASGSALAAFLTVRGIFALWRLRSESVSAGPEWEARAKKAVEQAGMSSVPQVAFAAGVVVPFAMGGRQPLILLPESARDLEAQEADAILVHEAAHIAHRHPRLGALMTLISIVYGWIPTVRGMLEALADAMEAVCDNHVVRAQGDGRALGRCLVRAAETVAANRARVLPGSAILHGRRGLRRRLARVLETNMNRETTLTRSGKLAAAFALLACVGVCSMARIAPADAEQKAQAWEAYFPLTVGTEWQYRGTYTGQEKPVEHQTIVRRRIALKTGDTCAEIETRVDERHGGFYYFGLRKDGYFSYANSRIGGPGVTEGIPPTPQVLLPLKRGQTWTWHEPWRGQIASDDGNIPDTSAWGTDCTATIEELNAEVTVPAGKYRALCVRIQRKSQHKGDSEEKIWYVKGVGMVRQEVRRVQDATHYATASLVELVAFTPGSAKAATPEDILPLVRNQIAGSLPRTLREIDLSGGAFRSRFAVAQWGNGQRIIYRVSGRSVIRFNPQRAEDWNILLAEDGVERPGFGGSIANMAFVKDMGTLFAESLGYETDGTLELSQMTTRDRQGNGTEIVFTLAGTMQGGNSLKVEGRIEVSKQGTLTDLNASASR